MKKLIYIFLFFSSSLFSQNLIPNGDFELGPDSTSAEWLYWVDSTCTYADTVLGPDFWTVVNPSPDRLVEGDICPAWDNDTAYSGKAYINIGTIGPGSYEAGKTTLISPIEKDSFYQLSYYVNLEGGCGGSQARLAFVFNNGGDSILSPWITLNSWQYHDSVFKASANSTEIKIIGAGNSTSCAEIDSVSLVKFINNAVQNYWIAKKNVKLYPIPSTGLLWISGSNIEDINIYNTLGQKMNYTVLNKTQSSIHVDLCALSKDIYIVQIKTQKELITEKILLTK